MGRGKKITHYNIAICERVSIRFKGFYIVFRDVTVSVKELIVNALQHQVTVCLKVSMAYQASIKGHTCPFSVPGTCLTTKQKANSHHNP